MERMYSKTLFKSKIHWIDQSRTSVNKTGKNTLELVALI